MSAKVADSRFLSPTRKGQVYPLSYYDKDVRAWYFDKLRWQDQREENRARLYWAACNGVPGAVYRYFHFTWTHMHPFFEWPQWWGEQSERIDWLHRQYSLKTGRIVSSPWNGRMWSGPPIDPSVLMWASSALMSSILMIQTSRTPEANLPTAGAYAVDVDNLSGVADDTNDGIWDSDGPWRNWSRLVTALENSTFGLGDTVYMRAGDYVPTALVLPANGSSTLSSSKSLWTSWPGERGHIDWSVNDDTTMTHSTGQAALVFTSANWRMKSIDYTSLEYGPTVENGSNNMGCEFIDLKHTRSGTSVSTGNAEHCLGIDDGSTNNDWLIEGCDLSDGNEVTGNGSTVYIIKATGVCRNNLIGATGASGYALHVKRMNASTTLGNITISNNIISRYGTAAGCIFYNNTAYGLVQHNCFSAAADGQAMYGSSSGSGASPWYRNQVLHNTCRRDGSNPFGLLGIDNNNTDNGENGMENIVQDNVIDGRTSVMSNQTAYTHDNDFDYNLHDGTVSNPFREFSTNYTSLANWVTNTTYMPAHDANSEEETIDWDTTFSRWVAANYALAGTSAGSGASSTSTDMGADVSLVGPAVLGY